MASINIGYVGYLIYEFFAHLRGDAYTPDVSNFMHILDIVAWICLGVSVLFFLGFVFLYFRAENITHEGWETREEQEIEVLGGVPVEPHNERWEQAVTLANSIQIGDWRRAILEADILLHELLNEKGFIGSDVGEQLKGASHAHFATLDMAWEAHRVRNLIAHEGETFPLDQRTTLTTVDKYRQVFEEFGYI